MFPEKESPRTQTQRLLPAVLLLSLFLLTECLPPESRNTGELTQPRTAQVLTPQPRHTQEISQGKPESQNPTPEAQALQDHPAPRIPLPGSYQLLQVSDMNLDYDHTEEQLIVARDTASEDLRLRLLIGDYNDSQGIFKEVWRGPINADLYRGLNIYVDDLIGNHELELICRGMTSEGEQTMDIFQRRISKSNRGNSYRKILSIQADGSIEIDKLERTRAYESGQTAGASYPVITTRSDPQSDNPLDLIQQTYLWQASAGQYSLVQTRKQASGSVQANQLREIYSGGVDPFLSYLDGAWYRASEGGGVPREFIYFDKDTERIFFYKDDVQEVYQWRWVRKTLFSRIRLRADNILLSSIQKYLIINAEDLDTITLSINYFIKDDQEWAGEYQRLNRDLQKIILKNRSFNPLQDPSRLTGVFKSNSGDEIIFTPPRFQMIRGEETLEGGYSIFQLNKTILELKAKKPNGRLKEVLHFEMSYQVREDELRIIRTLYLYPVILRNSGAYRTDNTMIRFEQITMKD